MAKIAPGDIRLLHDMYFDAPSMSEMVGARGRCASSRIPKRVYRLRRLGLCLCDAPTMHRDPGEPRCWALTPEGERLVELLDEIADGPDFVYDYKRVARIEELETALQSQAVTESVTNRD